MDKSKKTKEKLEASRNKLLDLTRRNRLLNFRAGDPAFEDGKRNSKHLVVEGDFESVWNQLVVREKRIEIRSIHNEISKNTETNDTDFLPRKEKLLVPKGVKSKIDKELKNGTIYSRLNEDNLRKRITSLRTEQNTLANSTGDSALFLAIGFLEWSEQNSTQKSFAPLCLVHIHIGIDHDKKTGNRVFFAEMDVDSPQSNPCLIEKLKKEFRLYSELSG